MILQDTKTLKIYQEERQREKRKEARRQKKRKVEVEDDASLNPEMAAMMGFSGFGSSKK